MLETIRNQGGKITTWGVGTNYITCAGNPAFGAVMKLSAIKENGEYIPKIKLSNQPEKITLPGIKQVYRLIDNDNKFCADIVTCSTEKFDLDSNFVLVDPEHKWRKKTYKPGKYQLVPLLNEVFVNGKAETQPTIIETKDNVKSQLSQMWPEYLRFVNPERYKVNLTSKLSGLKRKLIEEEVKRFSGNDKKDLK